MFWEIFSKGLLVGRKLFKYSNGLRIVHGDPFLLWRKMCSHPVNLQELLPALESGAEPDATKAIDALVEVFGLVKLDPATGKGLTDWEVVEVLDSFNQYLASLKKNGDPGPTSQPATDSLSSISLGGPGAELTGCSDCGSTSPASTPSDASP